MSMVLIDGIKDVVFHNGIVRIDCLAAGPAGEPRPSGTLLIPGAQVGPVLQALNAAMQQLDEKIRAQVAEQAAKAAAPAAGV